MRIRCRSAICSEYRPISGINPVGQCMTPCILKSELGEEKTAAGCCTNARYLRRRPRKRSLSRNFECRTHAMCRMSAAMMRGEREALLTRLKRWNADREAQNISLTNLHSYFSTEKRDAGFAFMTCNSM